MGSGIWYSENEIHWWQKNVQPLLYKGYMVFLDTKGTMTRFVAGVVVESQYGATKEELDFLMYDPWKRALLKGQVFNLFDKSAYFDY
ncbi:MAG: hypothetical protein ACFE9L_14090 [Candidatus Hodarchaeota archaeon]